MNPKNYKSKASDKKVIQITNPEPSIEEIFVIKIYRNHESFTRKRIIYSEGKKWNGG